MQKVKHRQMVTQNSQESSSALTALTSSDARTLPQFLSAHERQACSYAAALRRSPNRSHSTPWGDSRSSSPTACLSAKLSPLHLGSKGSSPSSTTSESTLERDRERPLSAGAVHEYGRNRYFENPSSIGRGQGRGQSSATSRGSYFHNKTGKTVRQPGRPRSNSYSVAPQSRPALIPGMLSVTENPSEERTGPKASDGGWIKVERQKRCARQEIKQVRGRRGRGSRGGRGAAGRMWAGPWLSWNGRILLILLLLRYDKWIVEKRITLMPLICTCDCNSFN